MERREARAIQLKNCFEQELSVHSEVDIENDSFVDSGREVGQNGSVAEIGCVLKLSNTDILAVIKAYLDESYNERIFLISGFAARVHVWDQIEAQWRKALNAFRIKRYHAVDCFHGDREFEGWPKQQRELLTDRLVRIITHNHPISSQRRKGIYGFTHAVRRDDFRDIMPSSMYPDEYTFLFQVTIRRVSMWLDEPAANEKIQVILDQNQEFGGTATKVFNQIINDTELDYRERRLEGISFQRSEKFIPLQASDLLAYETLRYVERRKNPRIARIREAIDLRGEMFHSRSLLAILRTFGLTQYLCRTLKGRF